MTCLALVDGVCQTYCILVVFLPPVHVFLLMNTAETWQHFRFPIYFWLHMFLILPGSLHYMCRHLKILLFKGDNYRQNFPRQALLSKISRGGLRISQKTVANPRRGCANLLSQPMKLWEDNVFSRVCVSIVGPWGGFHKGRE